VMIHVEVHIDTMSTRSTQDISGMITSGSSYAFFPAVNHYV
jgi:hypothetical protein